MLITAIKIIAAIICICVFPPSSGCVIVTSVGRTKKKKTQMHVNPPAGVKPKISEVV
jgi:hypothetical protein